MNKDVVNEFFFIMKKETSICYRPLPPLKAFPNITSHAKKPTLGDTLKFQMTLIGKETNLLAPKHNRGF